MKLYQSNGYANMPDIIESETPFVLCIGGRGTGKTYGARALTAVLTGYAILLIPIGLICFYRGRIR